MVRPRGAHMMVGAAVAAIIAGMLLARHVQATRNRGRLIIAVASATSVRYHYTSAYGNSYELAITRDAEVARWKHALMTLQQGRRLYCQWDREWLVLGDGDGSSRITIGWMEEPGPSGWYVYDSMLYQSDEVDALIGELRTVALRTVAFQDKEAALRRWTSVVRDLRRVEYWPRTGGVNARRVVTSAVELAAFSKALLAATAVGDADPAKGRDSGCLDLQSASGSVSVAVLFWSDRITYHVGHWACVSHDLDGLVDRLESGRMGELDPSH